LDLHWRSWSASIWFHALDWIEVRVQLQSSPTTPLDSKDNSGRTPLSWAAENGHEVVVNLLLETGKAEADSKDDHGHTPRCPAIIVLRIGLGLGLACFKRQLDDGLVPVPGSPRQRTSCHAMASLRKSQGLYQLICFN
jgi:hypothetical protein